MNLQPFRTATCALIHKCLQYVSAWPAKIWRIQATKIKTPSLWLEGDWSWASPKNASLRSDWEIFMKFCNRKCGNAFQFWNVMPKAESIRTVGPCLQLFSVIKFIIKIFGCMPSSPSVLCWNHSGLSLCVGNSGWISRGQNIYSKRKVVSGKVSKKAALQQQFLFHEKPWPVSF